MNKVLVTGGAGFIGSHIVNKLLGNNYQVIVVDNLSSGTKNNLPKFGNLNFYQLNVAKDDLKAVFEKEKPNYVVHLAAQTSVNYSMSNPYFDADMNIIATIKLLELCPRYNKNL